MSTFNTTKFISTALTEMGDVVRNVKARLEADGYTVDTQNTSEGYFISLSKGGLFKSVLGLKTSLNVTLKRVAGGINAEAKVGIFAQQAIPTAISMFVTWPVLITQVVGMINQSKLDDVVIGMIEEEIRTAETTGIITQSGSFCCACGKEIESDSIFCPICGAKQ